MSKPLVEFPIDPYPFHLVFFNDKKKAQAWWKKKFGEDRQFRGDETGSCRFRGDWMLMAVFDGRMSSLVHEATHVMIEVLDYCGQPISHNTHECCAYLSAHIFKKCRPHVRKKRITK